MRTDLKQYILVRVTEDNEKRPLNKQGYTSGIHDVENWMTYDEAHELAAEKGLKVGFVLREEDPYFCIDIDHCLVPDASGPKWSKLANEVCLFFNGAFVEVSTSGTGLHIWGRHLRPLPPHRNKNIKLGLEFYHKDRFIVLGSNGVGDPDFVADDNLIPFISSYFQPDEKKAERMEWSHGPVAEWNGEADDERLLAIMRSKQSVAARLGSRVSFEQLWTADVEALSSAFPNTKGTGPYDASSADMALAQHLAFWTGKDCDRILKFMLLSALKRPKWDDRFEDYLKERTILKACSQQVTVYSSGHKTTMEGGIDRKLAGGVVELEDFATIFQGMTYIISENAALVPGGNILSSERFNVVNGMYRFVKDNDGHWHKSAWDAFTTNMFWRPPLADGVCFRPDYPAHKIIEEEGKSLINLYSPCYINREDGNIEPFMKLLETIFPVSSDRDILLSYMAAIVQYPGRKFGWAPLIQGPEGNGKTFITTMLADAVGKVYSHSVKASELTSSGAKFNSWLFKKLFISVEDIKIENLKDMEVLKPLITDERIEIQAKGKDQFTADNRANFLFTSNHLDALKLHDGSRRYAPFMAAQQNATDMQKAGLTNQFYADLWDWARGRNEYEGKAPGSAIIAKFLKDYKIPDVLNPARSCTRAPRTSCWEVFIEASADRVQQEVLEAVGQGRQGFRGGWISSIMLDRLLNEVRLAHKVPLNERGDLLKRLGYVPHKGLPGGRATCEVVPDGGRPRLFVRRGHLSENLVEPKAIVAAYATAQQDMASPYANSRFG